MTSSTPPPKAIFTSRSSSSLEASLTYSSTPPPLRLPHVRIPSLLLEPFMFHKPGVGTIPLLFRLVLSVTAAAAFRGFFGTTMPSSTSFPPPSRLPIVIVAVLTAAATTRGGGAAIGFRIGRRRGAIGGGFLTGRLRHHMELVLPPLLVTC